MSYKLLEMELDRLTEDQLIEIGKKLEHLYSDETNARRFFRKIPELSWNGFMTLYSFFHKEPVKELSRFKGNLKEGNTCDLNLGGTLPRGFFHLLRFWFPVTDSYIIETMRSYTGVLHHKFDILRSNAYSRIEESSSNPEYNLAVMKAMLDDYADKALETLTDPQALTYQRFFDKISEPTYGSSSNRLLMVDLLDRMPAPLVVEAARSKIEVQRFYAYRYYEIRRYESFFLNAGAKKCRSKKAVINALRRAGYQHPRTYNGVVAYTYICQKLGFNCPAIRTMVGKLKNLYKEAHDLELNIRTQGKAEYNEYLQDMFTEIFKV